MGNVVVTEWWVLNPTLPNGNRFVDGPFKSREDAVAFSELISGEVIDSPVGWRKNRQPRACPHCGQEITWDS